MKTRLLHSSLFFFLALALSATLTYGQSAASVTWNLVSPDSLSPTTTVGNITGAVVTNSDSIAVRDITASITTSPITGVTKTMRWWPNINNTAVSWGNETVQNNNRWIQFSVSPQSGNSLVVDSISIWLGGGGTTHIRANLYYSTDSTFTNMTLLNPADTGLVLTQSAINQYAYNVNVLVNEGKSLYFRVYPFYDGSPSTSKYIYTQYAQIFGNTTSSGVFSEDFKGFTVGANLAGQSGWTKGGSGPDLTIGNTSPLTYPGYNLGGGEYAIMPTPTSTSSRVYKTFSTPITNLTNTTFFYSFLLNVSSVTSNSSNNYFMSLGNSGTGTGYFAKMFARSLNTGYILGISKTTNTATYDSSTILDFNKTYLIVARYSFHNTGAAHADSIDDECYLWINPASASEPLTSVANCKIISGTGGVDDDGYSTPPSPYDVGNFIWHNRGTGNPVGSFDGVSVGYGSTSAAAWTMLNPGPLPVELSAFTAIVGQKSVRLNWQTATETNNAGFDVERSSDGTNFQKIAFVKGNGNSTNNISYSFTDDNLKAGKYSYRLKQIDYSGKYEYSKVVEAEILSAPTIFSLSQNYPNPFNPSTIINFTVEKTGLATLKVYNVLGQEVATLFNGIAVNGQVHAVNFDASKLSSGVYFYQLQQGNQVKIQKMMLMK